MDDFRRQLDALMGTNRNGDKPGVKRKTFIDHEFCKYYIAGLCPHELLSNTVRIFSSFTCNYFNFDSEHSARIRTFF
jgi:hypothetical protein